MKIVHLSSGGDVGGAKTHVLSLLQELGKTEDVRLICFTDGDFAREAAELGIHTEVIQSMNFFSVVSRVQKTLQSFGAQIVHCHGARANLVGSILKKRMQLPVITTVHSDYKKDYMGRPLAHLFYGTANAYALRRLDYYIGVSDPTADMLISRKFDPQRIFSIYNGVRCPGEKPQMEREEYLRSLGVKNPETCVVFGIAARLSPVKDIGTLIRAFGEASKECENIHLLIAGDGEERQKLEKLAQEHCPQGNVTFCGWVSDMASFYNALDVNTLSSLTEAFPYALPEGASHHCATISSRVGGVPHYIEHGVDGLLFDSRDENTLKSHILRLAQDDTLRKTLAQRLYDKTQAHFSVEAMTRHQKEIYTVILRRKARNKGKRDGVMVCGAYGRGNAGDDAILESIVAQMRAIDEDVPIYVLSRKPLQTSARHRVGSVHTFHYFAYCRALRKTRLYINGGGSLIQDVTSSRSLWYYLLSIATAKLLGNRVLMYGCGIGPVSRPFNKKLAGRIIDRYADVITLRENFSLETLKEMGVSRPEMKITADPAILLAPAQEDAVSAFLQQHGVKDTEKLLLVSLRKWKDMGEKTGEVVSAVREISQKYGLRPVFLAMEPKTDKEICKAAAHLYGDALVFSAPQDSSLLVGLIRRAELILSMRLHALIFAAGVGTPLVGLSYDPKVMGFVRYLGQDLCLPLDKIQKEALCTAVDTALSGSFDYDAEALRLRALAKENQDAAEVLLQS